MKMTDGEKSEHPVYQEKGEQVHKSEEESEKERCSLMYFVAAWRANTEITRAVSSSPFAASLLYV